MKEPATKEEFISRHSAYFQSIGFDEQFAAFIYYMLDLGYEDSIHYECDDDFVIDRARDGFIIKEYYQVKHSKYKDTVLISKKKELRKINYRHFVFFICSQPDGASRPLVPSVFSSIDY